MAHPTPEVLALVALGEDVDPAAVEHIGGCDVCFTEVETLQQVVAVGRSLGSEDRLVTPHPRVWERITRDINDGRVIPLPGAVTLRHAPVVPPAEPEPVPLDGLADPTDGPRSTRPARPPLRRRWVGAVAGIAAALVLFAGGFVVRGLLSPTPDVVGATQLNALPRWAGANGTAAVEKDGTGQRTLVITMEMPSTYVIDGTFEVWMSDSRAMDMVPMGTMSGLSSRFLIPASVDLEKNPIVDVSLEPQGDTDPTHSDVSVLRGRLKL